MEELNNKGQEEKLPEGNPPENIPPENVPPEGNLHGIKPRISPIAAAFIGLIGGFLLYQIVGGLLTLVIFNFDLKNASINAMRLMTMGGQILFILLPALILTKYIYEDVSTVLRIKLPNIKEILLFVAGIIILSFLLQNYLYIQNYYINEFSKYNQTIKALKTSLDSLNDLVEKTYGDLLAVHNPLDLVLVIAVVSIVPAICEETMFRGFIQRSFEFKLSPFLSAFITAVFFGLYHFNPYGLIPLIGLGFFFGYAGYKSGSILVPMFLHFLNNLSAVILYLVFGNDELISSTVVPQIDIRIPLFGLLAFALLFVGYINIVKNYYKKIKTT
jgi:uncharacterized protein